LEVEGIVLTLKEVKGIFLFLLEVEVIVFVLKEIDGFYFFS
jgi:hypothetical protein